MPDPQLLDLLHEASQRLVRSVDGVPDTEWRRPSLLPGWSRAHVAAHLVLNAEGLADALEGLGRGEAVPMYRSATARDEDIEALAAEEATEVRNRLLSSTARFAEAVAAVPEAAWEGRIERVPGGRSVPAAAVPAMRWREVEVHHVDLDAGYGPADWPLPFADALVDAMADRLADRLADGAGDGAGVRVVLVDAGRERGIGSVGPEAPVVRGSAAEVGWWLSGRRPGPGLECDRGALPQIGEW